MSNCRERVALGVIVVAMGAGGCQSESLWASCSDDDECAAGSRCIGGQCRPWTETDGGTDGDADADADVGPSCFDHTDCDSGFCVGGQCCSSAERICGESCCETYEICFAQACVVPRGVCHSTFDCEEGQYCELSLGDDGEPEGDGGVDGGADAGGPTCLYPTPRSGRCLDLPPPCPEGEPPTDGRVCIPECEYRPEVGPLEAEIRWRWGADEAVEYRNRVDVWATPAVGRVTDTNCDGLVNELDPPAVVFVSGNSRGTCCQCTDNTTSDCQTGALRVLDGLTGREIWSLRRAADGSSGFAGTSVAIGHLIPEGGLEGGATTVDIAALTGEGRIAIIGSEGELLALSDTRVPGAGSNNFGWGGGLAIADMNGDGEPEIAYGAAVYTVSGGAIEELFRGAAGTGGTGGHTSLSTFADLDAASDGHAELVAGNTVYLSDGAILWQRDDLSDGFSAVADFDRDGEPEVVLVARGQVFLLAGATGETLLGPAELPSDGHGGPPTVADFDGDGYPEIGVAQKSFYTMLNPQMEITEGGTSWQSLDLAWEAPNHDMSSSVTGSTVFDFEGDGSAEVIYNDECFLWVYDGATGEVRFAAPTTSFTGTEASLVADVDGDGHAEMLMISNGADPSSSGWGCDVAPWNQADPESVRPAWQPPAGAGAWRGVTLWGDVANSWVGTRTLWNQHTYHVSNICDHRDDACDAPNVYGGIPARERPNWMVPWLDNFRQNVQDQGIYDAPDATVSLEVTCVEPPELHAFVRNLGAAVLPAGVVVELLLVDDAGGEQALGTVETSTPLYPGQVAELVLAPTGEPAVTTDDTFAARIVIDPVAPRFHECREDNNSTAPTRAACLN